jgi:pyridoxal-phosphate dependent enzyme
LHDGGVQRGVQRRVRRTIGPPGVAPGLSSLPRSLKLTSMTIHNDVLDAIGGTPLVKLRRASELTGCAILGKAEFMNPGQSVKDRAALFIVRDAERRGVLRPGGVIVEGTAGNTGIGLALVGNALGYRTAIVIPEPQSRRRRTCCASPAPNSSRRRRSPTPIRTTT